MKPVWVHVPICLYVCILGCGEAFNVSIYRVSGHAVASGTGEPIVDQPVELILYRSGEVVGMPMDYRPLTRSDGAFSLVYRVDTLGGPAGFTPDPPLGPPPDQAVVAIGEVSAEDGVVIVVAPTMITYDSASIGRIDLGTVVVGLAATVPDG